ncbi:FAD-dependent monooxygenase yanF [Paramyrothecium foliicola]|nr:FAD-dependent monooxygenase yanF [Paramyrothecium foliicola]
MGAKLVTSDYDDIESLTAAMESVDAVFHSEAQTFDPAADLKRTRNVIDTARASSAVSTMFLSTEWKTGTHNSFPNWSPQHPMFTHWTQKHDMECMYRLLRPKTNANMSTNLAKALDDLEMAFPGRVTTAKSEGYTAAVTKAWSQTCWEEAAAYVYLQTAVEVSQALLLLEQTATKFAIRTTGHNPNSGFSSVDKLGIVIDIGQMKTRALSADGIASVGAGNTWGEVYSWLEDNKRSAIGGRDQQVGVAGFLLGGGMGAFPNLYGLGTDGVVVLADGTIVEANKGVNNDLYTALKGGGSNFGIVTRFDLRTYPLLEITYAINLYSPSDYIEINKATVATQEAMEVDSKIGSFTNFNAGFVAVGTLYAGVDAPLQTKFSQFHRLSSHMATVTPTTNGTLLSLAQAMGHAQEAKKRAICTVTTKVSQKLYDQVYESWVEACKKLPEGAVLHYTIQPVGTAAIRIGQEEGGNILGLEDVPQCCWVFTCEWSKDGTDDALIYRLVDDLAQTVQSLAQDLGILLEFLLLIEYMYNGAKFSILVSTSDKHLPFEYNLEQSIEGKLLIELSDLTWGEFDEEMDKNMEAVEDELARIALDACFPLMQELGPPAPLPEPRTMQEQLYPPLHTLQILTENGKLVGRKLNGYQVPEKYTPVPDANIDGLHINAGVPIIHSSEIILQERLQSLVWKVTVNGEDMICKISSFVVPSFKGIVESHRGKIGLLLGYINHKHHSLRAILDSVDEGSLPETEATPELKNKWAGQVKESLEQLHKLGILWRDIKTDNVLIDDNGDAFLIDLGGGNTIGWVDRDKYGTLEGEAQGLEKLLKALGQEE